jgi:hypothetical protein
VLTAGGKSRRMRCSSHGGADARAAAEAKRNTYYAQMTAAAKGLTAAVVILHLIAFHHSTFYDLTVGAGWWQEVWSTSDSQAFLQALARGWGAVLFVALVITQAASCVRKCFQALSEAAYDVYTADRTLARLNKDAAGGKV